MKLRKLLPLATFTTVAGMSMSSLASCSCGPTEYEIEIIAEDNITVDAATFKLNQPLVITYSITGDASWQLDKASSKVTIGQKDYTVDTLLNDEKNHAIIVSAEKINNSKIKVDLIARNTETDVTNIWTIHNESGELMNPDDDWADLPQRASSETHFSNIASYEYLSAVSIDKAILAGDLAYSYYKNYQRHKGDDTPPNYVNYDYIKTTIGDIDADDSRINFSIECVPQEGHEDEYIKLDVKEMQFALIYCSQTGTSDWYYTLDPLVYWLIRSQYDKDAAKTYIKNDHKWEITYTTTQGVPGTPINSNSTDAALSQLLESIRTLQFSFWTHYCENMEPAS